MNDDLVSASFTLVLSGDDVRLLDDALRLADLAWRSSLVGDRPAAKLRGELNALMDRVAELRRLADHVRDTPPPRKENP